MKKKYFFAVGLALSFCLMLWPAYTIESPEEPLSTDPTTTQTTETTETTTTQEQPEQQMPEETAEQTTTTASAEVAPLGIGVQSISNGQQLQDAITAATDGDIVTIDADMTLDRVLQIDKSLTLRAAQPIVLHPSPGARHLELTGSGTTLAFENVTLDGNDNGGGIDANGTITLQNAVVTTCRQSQTNIGGGLSVLTGSNIILSGGSYSDNRAYGRGGGIFMQENSQLTINDGAAISNNQALDTNEQNNYGQGGGIYANKNCTITLNNGAVNGNKAFWTGGGIFGLGAQTLVNIFGGTVNNNLIEGYGRSDSRGGGVQAYKVVMTGGTVSGNEIYCDTSTPAGAGISATSQGDDSGLDLSGGEISGNKLYPQNAQGAPAANGTGGGICVSNLNMTGGIVSNNSAGPATRLSRGGGISLISNGGQGTITGGEIFGNSADAGGGVYVAQRLQTKALTIIGGTTVIRDNYVNSAFGGGGVFLFSNNNGTLPDFKHQTIIGGNVQIINNQANAFTGAAGGRGGGVATNTAYIDLVIQDNAVISGNESSGFGGGIDLQGGNSEVSILGNASITGNKSVKGGGLSLRLDGSNLGSHSYLGYDGIGLSRPLARAVPTVTISGNSASEAGGGAYIQGVSTLQTQNGVVFSNNSAWEEGVERHGGAIFTDDLNAVTIGADTVFADNMATLPYYIQDQNDIDLHQQNIACTQYTTPFEYAYNNYDINYNSGSPYALFDVQYRDGDQLVQSLSRVVSGSPLAAPQPPSREGYQFMGWYQDPAFTLPWDFETDVITADTVLYARFDPLAAPQPQPDEQQVAPAPTVLDPAPQPPTVQEQQSSTGAFTGDNTQVTWYLVIVFLSLLTLAVTYFLSQIKRKE